MFFNGLLPPTLGEQQIIPFAEHSLILVHFIATYSVEDQWQTKATEPRHSLTFGHSVFVWRSFSMYRFSLGVTLHTHRVQPQLLLPMLSWCVNLS